jgi:hypothetical protein
MGLCTGMGHRPKTTGNGILYYTVRPEYVGNALQCWEKLIHSSGSGLEGMWRGTQQKLCPEIKSQPKRAVACAGSGSAPGREISAVRRLAYGARARITSPL